MCKDIQDVLLKNYNIYVWDTSLRYKSRNLYNNHTVHKSSDYQNQRKQKRTQGNRSLHYVSSCPRILQPAAPLPKQFFFTINYDDLIVCQLQKIKKKISTAEFLHRFIITYSTCTYLVVRSVGTIFFFPCCLINNLFSVRCKVSINFSTSTPENNKGTRKI